MSYSISKELFEAVKYTNVDNIELTKCYVNMELGIRYERQDELSKLVDCININDFFFKCKEWAYNQNNHFYIESGYTKYDCYAKVWFDGGRNKEFKAKSEQQAVFDATSWVLEQIKNNK